MPEAFSAACAMLMAACYDHRTQDRRPSGPVQRVHLQPATPMTDHRNDSDRTLCTFCGDYGVRPGWDFCERCNLKVFGLIMKALGKTMVRMIPEIAALVIIIFVLTPLANQFSWLVIPVLCVGIPRGWLTLTKLVERVTEEYASRYGYAHVWYVRGYVRGIQERAGRFRDEIRREMVAQSIPFSLELEEALRGERHPQDLPDGDLEAIQPAVEAVVKGHQQRQDSYGIEAGLPSGTDAVC